MEKQSDISEKIAQIINRQYGNYKGNKYKGLRGLHNIIRQLNGDEKFLQFLEMCEKENPKPLYQYPTPQEQTEALNQSK